MDQHIFEIVIDYIRRCWKGIAIKKSINAEKCCVDEKKALLNAIFYRV
jgi:hypothetical protein